MNHDVFFLIFLRLFSFFLLLFFSALRHGTMRCMRVQILLKIIALRHIIFLRQVLSIRVRIEVDRTVNHQNPRFCIFAIPQCGNKLLPIGHAKNIVLYGSSPTGRPAALCGKSIIFSKHFPDKMRLPRRALDKRQEQNSR